MKEPTKKLLRVLIPVLIVAAALINIFFFMELEIRGTICFYRHFYATPWEAMEQGGILNYTHTSYGLDEHTPQETFQIDETNGICVFLCDEVVILEELYLRDGGCRITGTETIVSYADVVKNTELGSLSYVELWLILPNGRYGQKCNYALRAADAEAPAGARVYPLSVKGETWNLIVTEPK